MQKDEKSEGEDVTSNLSLDLFSSSSCALSSSFLSFSKSLLVFAYAAMLFVSSSQFDE
jgi:hypothetical protein